MNKELVDVFRSVLEAKYEAHLSPEGKKEVRGLRRGGVTGQVDKPSPTAQGQKGSVAALAAKPKADRNRDPRFRGFKDTQAMKRYQAQKAQQQTASHDPRSEFIDRIVNNITEEGDSWPKKYPTLKQRQAERRAAKEAAKQNRPDAKKAFASMMGGGEGGESPAEKLQTPASLKKQTASHDPRSEFIDRIVNNISETNLARHAAAVQAKGEAQRGARMTARDIIDSAKANNPKPPKQPEPKKEEASNDPKVNFINRTVDTLMERLIGNQKKIDADGDGKLTGKDFKMLRKGKRKDEAMDPTFKAKVKSFLQPKKPAQAPAKPDTSAYVTQNKPNPNVIDGSTVLSPEARARDADMKDRIGNIKAADVLRSARGR